MFNSTKNTSLPAPSVPPTPPPRSHSGLPEPLGNTSPPPPYYPPSGDPNFQSHEAMMRVQMGMHLPPMSPSGYMEMMMLQNMNLMNGSRPPNAQMFSQMPPQMAPGGARPRRTSIESNRSTRSNPKNNKPSAAAAKTHPHTPGVPYNGASPYSHPKNNKLTTMKEINAFQLDDNCAVVLKLKSAHPKKGFCFVNCLTADNKKVVVVGFGSQVDTLTRLNEQEDNIAVVRFSDVTAIEVRKQENTDVGFDFRFVDTSKIEIVTKGTLIRDFLDLKSHLNQEVKVTGKVHREPIQRYESVDLVVVDESGEKLLVRIAPITFFIKALQKGRKYTFTGVLRDTGVIELCVNMPVPVIVEALPST